MADLTVVQASVDGIDPDASLATAASGGDKFVNDHRTVIYVKNGHATESRTVTIGAVVDKAIAVPAQSTRLIGPLDSSYDDSDGKVNLSYSDSGADITLKPIAVK